MAFDPNRKSNHLPFSNVREQNRGTLGKMGLVGLHSTCTFRILTYSRGQVKLRLDWNGKTWHLTLTEC